MKNYTILLRSALGFLFLLAVGLTGCDKTIEIHGNLEANTPGSSDANAGTWRMIVLASVNSINVAAPTAVTSDAYLAELAAVKDAQSKLTKEQKDIIKYWSAGGVLRWNQIFRDLVAEYNLPPAPKADNSYLLVIQTSHSLIRPMRPVLTVM
jgi:hypothetical protein